MKNSPSLKFLSVFALILMTVFGSGCLTSRSTSVDTVPAVTAVKVDRLADPAPEDTVEPADQPLPSKGESDFWPTPMLTDEEVDPDVAPGEDVSDASRDELSQVSTATLPAETVEQVALSVVEPQYDIPIVVNDRVRFWLDYYSKSHHKSFAPGIDRSGRYVPMFRKIFEEEGLPQDLVYMAHVESAFKDNAYSHAHAMGIWQFISSTGRHYDLKIDYWVDERRDPEKSARAAATYLKKLYGDFGDWYLALAAYNGGEGRVGRALKRTGEKDFWGLAETRHLRRETRNYVPAIIAATMIHKDPEAYGFSPNFATEIEYDSLSVDGAVDLQVLADCAGVDFETLRRLNPMLRRNQTPPNAKTDVRVPTGLAESTLLALGKVPKSDRVLYVRHRIRSGDSLYDLARAYNVTVGAIQQANNMGSRTMIREGKTLVIPTVAAGRFSSSRIATGTHVELPAGRPFTYRVRRGDTLSHIARRYDTTSSAIAAASRIRQDQVLQIGYRLTVVPGSRSAAMARSAASGGSPTVAGNRSSSQIQHHTVRRGDSLWKIASRYRTTVDELCQLNRISPSATLYPGTRLTVSP